MFKLVKYSTEMFLLVMLNLSVCLPFNYVYPCDLSRNTFLPIAEFGPMGHTILHTESETRLAAGWQF